MQSKSHSTQNISNSISTKLSSKRIMKRLRFEGDREELGSVNMANVLMLLSRGTNWMSMSRADEQSKVFECKTCNRIFGSFQALGGHRASHKRPKLALDHDGDHNNQGLVGDNKPKVHECSICGAEFALGQALGGHMRRHRATVNEGFVEKKTNTIGKKRVMLFGFELPIHG